MPTMAFIFLLPAQLSRPSISSTSINKTLGQCSTKASHRTFVLILAKRAQVEVSEGQASLIERGKDLAG